MTLIISKKKKVSLTFFPTGSTLSCNNSVDLRRSLQGTWLITSHCTQGSPMIWCPHLAFRVYLEFKSRCSFTSPFYHAK